MTFDDYMKGLGMTQGEGFWEDPKLGASYGQYELEPFQKQWGDQYNTLGQQWSQQLGSNAYGTAGLVAPAFSGIYAGQGVNYLPTDMFMGSNQFSSEQQASRDSFMQQFPGYAQLTGQHASNDQVPYGEIRFNPDGTPMWNTAGASAGQYLVDPSKAQYDPTYGWISPMDNLGAAGAKGTSAFQDAMSVFGPAMGLGLLPSPLTALTGGLGSWTPGSTGLMGMFNGGDASWPVNPREVNDFGIHGGAGMEGSGIGGAGTIAGGVGGGSPTTGLNFGDSGFGTGATTGGGTNMLTGLGDPTFGGTDFNSMLAGGGALGGAGMLGGATGTAGPLSGLNFGDAGFGGGALSGALSGILPKDLLGLLGKVAPSILGAIGANAKTGAFEDVANRFMGLGEPYRNLLQASYQPGFSLENEPGYQQALQTAQDTFLRAASAGRASGVSRGNPLDQNNPGAWAETQKYLMGSTLLPYLQNYRNSLASAGQLGVSQAAPAALGGAQSSGGVFDAIGYGLGQILNPQQDFGQQLMDWVKQTQNRPNINLGGPA